MPEMRVPGPDHPIALATNPRRMRARYFGHVIADTTDALTLKEAAYPAVTYFPRGDVSMEYLSRTEKVTHCPYKGDANYYTLLMEGRFAENAVWTYETPYPAMAPIAGRIAFYTDKVEVYEAGEGEDDADEVREAILHTDDGEGVSQREHWPPTAGLPRAETDD
ncbi:MAG: DUF427 domain-containing protein [Caulobacteraceae bacterium]